MKTIQKIKLSSLCTPNYRWLALTLFLGSSFFNLSHAQFKKIQCPQVTGSSCPVGPDSVMKGGSYTYQIKPIANATGYVWTVGANNSIKSGQGTTQITVTIGSKNLFDTICVYGEDSCSKGPSCCTDVYDYNVNNCSLSASITVNNNVGCSGGSTGAATANVGGGTQPYTFLWSNKQTSAEATGLSAGSYSVSITDSKSCSATAYVTITSPLVQNYSCPIGQDTVIAGNSYTYSISPIANATSYVWTVPVGSVITSGQGTTQITVTMGANLGTICVNGEDSCNQGPQCCLSITHKSCSFTSSVTVNSNAGCNGGSNGSATASASGGTAPYTYLWNNNQTGAKATGLSVGSYRVGITDSKGCTSAAYVTIPSSSLSVKSAITQGNYCINSGSYITVTPSGGNSPYTYYWSNHATTSTITGLSAGIYTLILMDNNGCYISVKDTITSQSSKIQISYTVTPLSCYGGSNGSVIASAANGTAPYTYYWSPSGKTGANATGLTSGIYTVVVTDANGCTNTATINVNEPLKVAVNITSVTNILCYGGSTGQARAVASGGASPYSYRWSNGQVSYLATGLTAGYYSVSVTDAHGCTGYTTVSVTQPSYGLFDSLIYVTNVKCYNAATGCASISVFGGTSPYSYSWSSGATTYAACGLSAGAYKVLITDAHGCTLTASATVTQAAAIKIGLTIYNISCFGETNGRILAFVSGGTSPYAYKWSNGGTYYSVSNLSPGNYTVNVTDYNSCTATASATVTQPPMLRDSIATQSCSNGKGNATAGVKGGTAPYSYSWYPSGGANQMATGLSNGVYRILVTDKNSCTASATVSISCPPEEPFNRQNTGNDLCCPEYNGDDVVIFPNPNKGQFTIIDNGQWTMDNERKIEIYDIWGKQVYSNYQITKLSNYQIDLSSQPAGVYLLRIFSGDGQSVIMKKVIKD